MDLTDAVLNNVHTDMQEHYFFLFINGKNTTWESTFFSHVVAILMK